MLDDVLALLSTLVSDVMPGVSGAWYLPDPARDRVVAVHAFGPAAHILRDATPAVGAGLTGWVAASRQSIVNSDAALDLGQRADGAVPPLRSCMSVPIVNGSNLLAVLSLYADSPEAFAGDQSRVVQMLAPHVADAIRSAKDAGPTIPAAAPQTLRLVSAR
jgi:GAF domain-containing protein